MKKIEDMKLETEKKIGEIQDSFLVESEKQKQLLETTETNLEIEKDENALLKDQLQAEKEILVAKEDEFKDKLEMQQLDSKIELENITNDFEKELAKARSDLKRANDEIYRLASIKSRLEDDAIKAKEGYNREINMLKSEVVQRDDLISHYEDERSSVRSLLKQSVHLLKDRVKSKLRRN